MEKSTSQYKEEVNQYFKRNSYFKLVVVRRSWYIIRTICTFLLIILLIFSIFGKVVIAKQTNDENCEFNLFTIKHEISQDSLEKITKYIPLWKNMLKEGGDNYETNKT